MWRLFQWSRMDRHAPVQAMVTCVCSVQRVTVRAANASAHQVYTLLPTAFVVSPQTNNNNETSHNAVVRHCDRVCITAKHNKSAWATYQTAGDKACTTPFTFKLQITSVNSRASTLGSSGIFHIKQFQNVCYVPGILTFSCQQINLGVC